jgi:hypothetical protein
MGLAGSRKKISIETNGNNNKAKKAYAPPRFTKLTREEGLARIRKSALLGYADARQFLDLVTGKKASSGSRQ